MIKKTKDYDLFTFRDDNREKIDQNHITKLMESIKSRNLLELRPIVVNDKMEVIDGQHRLMAARNLGVDIFYQQEEKLEATDIIKMNISKSWGINDYLNFYCHHGYEEYIKLRNFMKKNNINLKVAMSIALGQVHVGFNEFRSGDFKFNDESLDVDLDICWDTINYIKKMNGQSPYTTSGRFWKALIKLINHPNFDITKWRNNMQKMISHFTPKARLEDYCAVFQHVYNYRNNQRINILEDDI